MAIIPMFAWAARAMAAVKILAALEVIADQGHIEKSVFIVHEGIHNFRLVGMRRHAEETHLALFFQFDKGLPRNSGAKYPFPVCQIMELNDINIIRPKRLEARLDIPDRFLFSSWQPG